MSKRNPEEIDRQNRERVGKCDPAPVFGFFADVSAIPRGSGDMRRIGDFLVEFAKKRNLEWLRDDASNVIIRKPAQHSKSTDGVILQAHQDMVCVKTPESDHDFAVDPIEFVLRDGILTANGTTLGADDGIGMALAMAILDNADIPHPPIEALFTVDEETNMGGAKVLSAAMLNGVHLINIDSEDLGVAYTSCAAGCEMAIDIPLRREPASAARSEYRKIHVDGLSGGHSGVQINFGKANAFILLARVLHAVAEEMEYGLLSFDLGNEKGATNAIPAKASARVALAPDDVGKLEALVAGWRETLRREYWVADPDLDLVCRPQPADAEIIAPLTAESRDGFLRLLRLLPLGVFRHIQDRRRMEDILYKDLLVETSCNLGVASFLDDHAHLEPLARGSVRSVLDDLTGRIEELIGMAGGVFRVKDRTAGWEPAIEKPRLQQLFENFPGFPWELVGVHAGLECGCFIEKFAEAGKPLDAISVGPTVRNPHSPQELLETAAVRPVWDTLVGVLGSL